MIAVILAGWLGFWHTQLAVTIDRVESFGFPDTRNCQAAIYKSAGGMPIGSATPVKLRLVKGPWRHGLYAIVVDPPAAFKPGDWLAYNCGGPILRWVPSR